MGSRETIMALLNQAEFGIKDLDIAYEHYFSGLARIPDFNQIHALHMMQEYK